MTVDTSLIERLKRKIKEWLDGARWYAGQMLQEANIW